MSDPTFRPPITNPFGLTNVKVDPDPTFADIDGDGDLDAFVGNNDGNTRFYRNTGGATNPVFDAPTTNSFGLTDVGYSAKPTFADIDGDGDLDAFVGERYGNTLFYRNTGGATNPVFDTPTTNPFVLTDVGYSATPTFADIDGDGDLDAFVGNSQGNILFYRNTGGATNPIFAAPTTNPFGLTDVGLSAAPTFADIDGDGDLDAFVGERYGNTLFYRNTGGATNPVFAALTTNPFGLTDVVFSAAPTFADIDGDGDLDAVVGNRYGNTFFFENAPNRSPVAVNDALSTTENTLLAGNLLVANPTTPDSDPDNNPLTVTAVNGITTNVGTAITLGNGQLTVNANGTFNFNPNGGYESLAQGSSTQESFTYTISDGNGGTDSATATVTINGVNDAPVLPPVSQTLTDTATTDVFTPLVGTLVGTDAEGQAISYSLSSNPTGNYGSLTLDANTGEYSYSPNNTAINALLANATDTFNLTLTDADGASSTSTLSVNLIGANDRPIAVNDEVSTSTNTAITVEVAANDSDADLGGLNGATLTVTSTTNGSISSIDQDARLITFTPANNVVGQASFKYTLTDLGGLVSSEATVLVEVGNTIITGNKNQDIQGNNGNDYISAGNAKDRLEGLGGNDTLLGNNGADTLLGGSGNDILDGGNGPDLLTGGSGQDKFVITPSAGGDTITDFELANDWIDLGSGLTFGTGNAATDVTQTLSGTDVLLYSPSNSLLATLQGTSGLLNSSHFI